jgi:hypothetical protein
MICGRIDDLGLLESFRHPVIGFGADETVSPLCGPAILAGEGQHAKRVGTKLYLSASHTLAASRNPRPEAANDASSGPSSSWTAAFVSPSLNVVLMRMSESCMRPLYGTVQVVSRL